MMENRKEELLKKKAEMLKIMAHPMRLCILNCLIQKPFNVTGLADKIGLPQSTVSQHLSKLRLGNLVKGDRRGVEIEYTLVSEEVKDIIQILVGDCDGKIYEDYSEEVG